ncbi:hypothetical protein D9M72_551320 [compost metagenome]
MAGRIERGKRYEHDIRIEFRCVRSRTCRAESGGDDVNAIEQFAEDDRLLVHDHGKAEPGTTLLQPRHQRPDVDLGADRPEAGDDVSGIERDDVASVIGHGQARFDPHLRRHCIAQCQPLLAQCCLQIPR